MFLFLYLYNKDVQNRMTSLLIVYLNRTLILSYNFRV